MNRRSLLRLATTGSVLTSLAGCSESDDTGPVAAKGYSSDDTYVESPIPLDEIESPSIDDDCGTAHLPLSARLSNKPNHNVTDWATISGICSVTRDADLVLGNERSKPVTVAVEVDSSGDQVFDETYQLEPGETFLEKGGNTDEETEETFPREGDHEVTVTVNDEEPVTGGWYGISCDRHGIVIMPQGVAVGYEPRVKVAHGTCYAGEERTVSVYSDATMTITVRVHDRCRDTTVEETWEMYPDSVRRIREIVVAGGGVYEVAVDVEGGDRVEEEFDKVCRSLQVQLEDEDDIQIREEVI